jgi:acetyl esterase/lipase
MACLIFAFLASAVESRAEIATVKNVPYREGKDADPVRHCLDLYLPKGKKDFPVLLFLHGGGWKNGKKEDFQFLGETLAGHGIGVVAANYRLYPQVKFPANIEDVARAFAWTHKHIGKYGGRADHVFVGGHSSGGHLVSLLATDESYLKAEGLRPGHIRGVISISGLYSIPKGRFPLFDNTDEAAKKASPISQVQGGHPPFLLVYADRDFPRFGEMAEDFAKALREARCEVTCLKAKDRTHGSVALKIAQEGDPVCAAVLEFVAKHVGQKDNPSKMSCETSCRRWPTWIARSEGHWRRLALRSRVDSGAATATLLRLPQQTNAHI